MDPTDVTMFQFRQRLLETIEQKVAEGCEPGEVVNSLHGVEDLPPRDVDILCSYISRISRLYDVRKKALTTEHLPLGNRIELVTIMGIVSYIATDLAQKGLFIFSAAFAGAAVYGLVSQFRSRRFARTQIREFYQSIQQESHKDTLLQFYGKPPGEMVH